MAYDESKLTNLGHLGQAVDALKADYEEKIANIETGDGTGTSYDVATDDEVKAMLDEKLGTSDGETDEESGN